MTPPTSRSGSTNTQPTTDKNKNDKVIVIFRNTLFAGFAVAIALTWADAILEVITDALDTWTLGAAKIIGALVVTAFCLFCVMILTFLFDLFDHHIKPLDF